MPAAQSKKFGKGPLAIALQGSFGHRYYALGIICGLQERLDKKKIRFEAGSGCVEMLLPLWLYFSKQKADIRQYFSKMLTAGEPLIPAIVPGYDPVSVFNYEKHLVGFVQTPAQVRQALGNFSGPPGGLMFNPFYFNGNAGQEFERLMNGVDHPVFTNALNAQTFQEIYLYSGPLPPGKEERVLGRKGAQGRRRLAELDLERFVASGARPPFFAPKRVHYNGSVQYWMEGAMRCNPPLNPLIDVGASQILLIRFFAKRTSEIANEAELIDRYLDTVFTAPLEKEIDFIETVNRLSPANGKRKVEVLDAAECVGNFKTLVEDELDCLSHFQSADWYQWDPMFDRGVEAGQAIAEFYT